MLGDELDAAEDVHGLGRAWSKLPQVAAGLLREGVSGRDVAAVISSELGDLTRRAAVLAEQRLAAAGRGGAAVPLCDCRARLCRPRREPARHGPGQRPGVCRGRGRRPEDRWFARTRHAPRRHPARGRRALLQGRRDGQEPGLARLARHLARSASAAGSTARGRRICCRSTSSSTSMACTATRGSPTTLWREAFAAARGKADFAKQLVEAAGSNEPGFGWLGGLKTSSGRIDLKKAGLFGIVSAARALAICHHVVARSTPARIAGIKALDLGAERDLDAMRRRTSAVPGSDPGPAAGRHAARPSTHQRGCREELLPSATRTDCARRSGRSNISMHWFATCCSTADRDPAPNLAMRWREFGAGSKRAPFASLTCQIYPTCRRKP